MKIILSFAFLLATCNALPNLNPIDKEAEHQDLNAIEKEDYQDLNTKEEEDHQDLNAIETANQQELNPKRNEKRQLNLSGSFLPRQTQLGVYANLNPGSLYSPNFRGINDGQGGVIASSRPITVTEFATSPQTLGTTGSNFYLSNPSLGVGQTYPTTLGIGQTYPTLGVGVGQQYPSLGVGQTYPTLGVGYPSYGIGQTYPVGLGTTGFGYGTTGVGLGTTGVVYQNPYAGGYPYNIGLGGVNTLGLGGVGLNNLGGLGGLGYGGVNYLGGQGGLGSIGGLGGLGGVNSLGGFVPSTIGGIGGVNSLGGIGGVNSLGGIGGIGGVGTGRGFTHDVGTNLGGSGIIGTPLGNRGLGNIPSNDPRIYNNVGFNRNPGFNNFNFRDRSQRGFGRPAEERRPNRRERSDKD